MNKRTYGALAMQVSVGPTVTESRKKSREVIFTITEITFYVKTIKRKITIHVKSNPFHMNTQTTYVQLLCVPVHQFIRRTSDGGRLMSVLIMVIAAARNRPLFYGKCPLRPLTFIFYGWKNDATTTISF